MRLQRGIEFLLQAALGTRFKVLDLPFGVDDLLMLRAELVVAQ